MIWRVLAYALCAAAAFAQLPPPQAPLPSMELEAKGKKRAGEPEPAGKARLDVVVTVAQGQPIPGLTAADFSLETDGKAQKLEKCEYRADQPLRLAVIVDDLNLSLRHLNEARNALRVFAAKLRPNDEVAILRTSSGSGALDRFTADSTALQTAIERATYNPTSTGAPPDQFTAGALGVVRAVVEGMAGVPGRKAVLLISEHLRDPARGGHPQWAMRLTPLVHRGAAVFYGVDMDEAAGSALQLDQGVAEVAKDSGGLLFDRGEAAEALSRIARDQSAYYVLTYSAEGLSFDYIAGVPRVSRVVVKTSREDALLRARNGVFGTMEEDPYRDTDREFQYALGSELTFSEIRTKVTGLFVREAGWQINGIVHLAAGDLTFVKAIDGRYRASIDTATALYNDNGVSVKNALRAVDFSIGPDSFQQIEKYGFDYTVTLPVELPGGYQLRAAVRDSASGKIGSARDFVRADWGPAKLAMSSIVLRGEMEKNAAGVEVNQNPEENTSIRMFHAGRKFAYTYDIYNLETDAEKHSSAELRAQIWRDGAVIMEGEPTQISFSAADKQGRNRVAGVVTLKASIAPGHYVLGAIVTDKLSHRTATRFIDFDVRP
jgi:Ca-activated chloride channel family protein